ncbi:PEP-CTERM sorting domain-containing protein [Massilia pseudoviolaceinigra]|uniref:PEP-CTERM sorting domain-containing protein n=1 Tax=Massilia pseudoviolaceinigra TaxID=3057165 RepID=UPI00279687A6|nr:PEP-CTERM sorting domain-containing protein [Massilia sp. CCM 9206]MDQ1924164.1 PEP-CTERM sorting domain-containing protein [Massilia sp. CCM 9206]
MNAASTAHPRPVGTTANHHPDRKSTMLAHPLKIVAGLFAAGMLACAPAHAGYAKATASLNNIEFHLTDLDLTDNISPSIAFTSTDGGGSYFFSAAGEPSPVDFVQGYGAISRIVPNGGVSLSNAATSMYAEAHADTVPNPLGASSSTYQLLRFTLSPSTRLTFSAQADTFMEQVGLTKAVSIAGISGDLTTYINGVSGREVFSMNLTNTQGQRSQLLQGAFETGKAVGIGRLNAKASVELSYFSGTPTSPVPEPATYGMLAAGLLVIGAARRKARKA